MEGELDLLDFTKLGKIFISHYVDEYEVEIKDKWKYEDKIVKLVNAQEYLNKNYPENQGSETKILELHNKKIEGDLEVKDFPNLEKLDCRTNKLTSLRVINCPKLKNIYCHSNQLSNLGLDNLPQLELLYSADNYLEDLVFLKKLNQEKLTSLYLHNNNFSEQDLTVFSQFTKLQKLYIGNNNKEKIEKGVYNQFVGSLEPIKNLDELTEIDISNTNIDSGLKYLSGNIGTFNCEVIISDKFNFQVNKIREQLAPCDYKINSWKKHLEEWKNKSFTNEEIKQWVEVGLRLDKLDFAIYLKEKGYTPSTFSKVESQAQIWLDWKYCKDKRKDITKLDISNKGLEGSLQLEGFDNLEELNCSNNKLTDLYLNGLGCLSKINCSLNELNDTNFLIDLPNPQKLTYLNINDNNFQPQNLSFLETLTNLEELSLGTTDEKRIREGKYNRFTGSLEFLKDLSKLKTLNISNTEIETGLEYLLESVQEIDKLMEEIYNLKKSDELDSRYKKDLQKKKKELDNTCHRIDLLRIEEGYKNLVTSDKKETDRSKAEERTFIIGLDNREIVEEYQIQFPPK